jgi:hypothetical protein
MPSQQMVSTGDTDRTIYICLAGKFGLLLNNKLMGEVTPDRDGNPYGFMNYWPQTLKLIAAIPSKMLIIPQDGVRWLRDNEPVIAAKLFWDITDRMASQARSNLLRSARLDAGSKTAPAVKSDTGTKIPDSISLVMEEGSSYVYQAPRRLDSKTDAKDLGDL